MSEKKEKRGRKPETVKIEGDWEDAVANALKKPRPSEGWPDPDNDSHSNTENDPDSDQ